MSNGRSVLKTSAKRTSARTKDPSADTPASPEVAAAFEAFPPRARKRLMQLRRLIFSTAARTDGVGAITETLKWGEPAYLTEASKSGSTIRLGWKATAPDECAMYLNCRTSLVDDFRTRFPELRTAGNRAVLFDTTGRLNEVAARECIRLALTYHQRKRRG